jgi:hypothetical protein
MDQQNPERPMHLLPTCGSCKWFARRLIGQPHGDCHGAAPIPMIVGMVPPHLAGQPSRPVVDSYFAPVMDTTLSCRVHEPRLIGRGIDLSSLTPEEITET